MDALPRDIHLGMKVYDSQHKHIGKIDDLRFPENEGDTLVEPADIDGTDQRGRESLIDAVANVFGREDIPEPLRSRLLVQGYIRIDTAGLLERDRFILPSQIAYAGIDDVTLNVEKDALIKQP